MALHSLPHGTDTHPFIARDRQGAFDRAPGKPALCLLLQRGRLAIPQDGSVGDPLVATGRQNTTQMNTFCVGFLP